jgi:hypothetical protein
MIAIGEFHTGRFHGAAQRLYAINAPIQIIEWYKCLGNLSPIAARISSSLLPVMIISSSKSLNVRDSFKVPNEDMVRHVGCLKSATPTK